MNIIKNKLDINLFLLIIVNFVFLLPLDSPLVRWSQLAAALILFGWLPGYALLSALWSPQTAPLSPIERALLTLPLSYAVTTVLIMSLVFVGLPLTHLTLALSLSGVTLLALAGAWLRPNLSADAPLHRSETFRIWLLILLLAALFFRSYHVSYSDYQGDEAGILLQAVSLLQGDVEPILERFKGPGEVLILTAVGGLTNNFDELTARFPFSLASAIAVGLIFLLGTGLFSLPVGLIAAALATIEGVFVSYARTAQYQSVLLPLSLAAIFCYLRFNQQGGQSLRLHGVASFLLATACLFHFEALFLLPVAAYLTIAIPPQTNSATNVDTPPRRLSVSHALGLDRLTPRYLLRFWPSMLIFVAVTASFYVPFLLHPSLDDTGNYLENRIASGSLPPFNNFDHFFHQEALKYNSIYYAVLFGLALSGLMLARLTNIAKTGGIQNPFRFVSLILFFVITLAVILTQLGQFQAAAAVLAIATATGVGLLILSPHTTHAERLLWLWIAPSAWVYLFLVNRPGKHHYLFWSAMLILIGLAIYSIYNVIQKDAEQNRHNSQDLPEPSAKRWLPLPKPISIGAHRSIKWGAVGIGIAFWLLSANYTHLLLLRTDLEYMLTYPEHQRALYPVDEAFPYRTRIGFGYPYRLGWQTVGQLRRSGQLAGTWAANDEGNTLTWYMLGTAQTVCYPQYIIRSEITFKGSDLPLPFFPAEFGYRPLYEIWGNDRLRATVLTFDPDGLTPEVMQLDEAARHPRSPIRPTDFGSLNQALTPTPHHRLDPAPALIEGSEIKTNAPAAYLERAQQLKGRVTLLGYDVEMSHQTMLPLNLYWRTEESLSLRYKVFIHLLDEAGQRVAQADDFPVCGTSHTNSWFPGSVVRDRHLLHLPAELPAGDYRLRIGMYEPDLNLRLNFVDVAGNEQGNSLLIEDFIQF